MKDFKRLLSNSTLDEVIKRGIPPGDYFNLPSHRRLQRLSLPIDDLRQAEHILYAPTFKQMEFHALEVPNGLIEGARGTGKSVSIRQDAHMRATSYPGYTYLILRRITRELRQSHLKYIGREMKKLGGYYNKTEGIAYYPNGSQGHYSHCELDSDITRFLGSEYYAVYFDEITTFTWKMITEISACARVPEGSGLMAVVRGGTNPIGPSAREVKRYFITHDVDPEADPEYDPSEWTSIRTTLDDNPHIDKRQYVKRLKNLPAHLRRAWLDGEWLIEGAYFSDFMPTFEGSPWHVIQEAPVVREHGEWIPVWECSWINIYRALDWGYAPDPAVCLWIAVLPSGEEIVIKEKHWNQTIASEVGAAIVRHSQGMRIIETFCDPSMFAKTGTTSYSVGDLIEQAGIPLTPSLNDRERFGYAIHDHLNTLISLPNPKQPDIPVLRPKLKILAKQNSWESYGCEDLIRTLPEARMDERDQRKLAAGDDHWIVSLAYFCIGSVPASQDPRVRFIPGWMRKYGRLRTRTVVPMMMDQRVVTPVSRSEDG